MPRGDARIKQLLTSSLTEAFTTATRFSQETLGIRFLEYDPGEAANEGRPWDGQSGKPYLHMVLHSPPLQDAERKALVESLTKAFVDVLGNPEWTPVIFLSEIPEENIGVGGRLLSDS